MFGRVDLSLLDIGLWNCIMGGVALFLSWNLLGYRSLFDTELWSFGFILASEARTNWTLRYFARILNLQVFRPDLESTGIVPSALGLGIGKFQGISLDIGDFSVGFFD
ncbi:hypothetical protein GLOIN_2v1773969 [Rhizophagus irregularis DAOM 181602=DAOM 197198]|nr:hypothetical protein GLOIN_2v1773969 [Rhizophagus irregularis DAOM 181602=DAOM 197198]